MTIFSSLWQRRWLRILCWLCVTLAVLLLLAHAIINWSGERRWQRIKQTLATEKETLDFRAILPQPIPEAQNFAAIESLRRINVGKEGSPEEAKRDALKALRIGISGNFTFGPGLAYAKRVDPQKLFDQLKAELHLPAEADDPARAIREALEKKHPLLKTLADTALERPQAEFVPSLRDQSLPPILFSLPFPHYSVLSDIARALRLHGSVCLETKDIRAAVADALAILRLSEATAREPLFIGHLVSVTLQQVAMELIWAALATHQVTEEDLRAIELTLSRADHEAALLAACRGELIAATSTIEALERTRDNRAAFLYRGTVGQPSTPEKIIAFLVPTGFLTHNKCAMAEEEWENIIKPLKQGGIRGLLRVDHGDFKRSLLRPDRFFVTMVYPTVGTMTRLTAYAETNRRQALIACALERHFLQHRAYPADLASLPLPAETKNDLFDGKPMRYRFEQPDRFVLWSIGPDGKDDDGKVTPPPTDKPNGSLSREGYKGDWAWRYHAGE